MAQLLWKTVQQLLKGWSIELPREQEIPVFDVSMREMKTYVYTNTSTQMFIDALNVTAKKWKQPIWPMTVKIHMDKYDMKCA